MLRLAWATDLHLDMVSADVVAEMCACVNSSGATALLLGGDTAQAADLERWLRFIADRVLMPVYFVLGNHDFYAGSIARVREAMGALEHPRLTWLPRAGVVRLGDGCALVGHGGWGDARYGDFLNTPVELNDYRLIEELLEAYESRESLQVRLQELGDDAARTLRPALTEALDGGGEVVVLTHVPPLLEACWYQGEISNDDWSPGFTCKAVGDLLLELCAAAPDTRVTVLCGHTHSAGVTQPLPNLTIHTGSADYGQPKFELLTVGK